MDHETDRAIDETRTFLAARNAPDVRDAVMRKIADLEPAATIRASFFRMVADLMWAPRHIAIRPAYALAGATIAILVLVPYMRATPPVPASEPQVFVQFRLDTMAARVQLAGSFTNWEPRYELHESVPGIWTITIPLTQGVHDYAFVLDGQRWVADPNAPQIGDGFGGTNNRLALLTPDPPQL